MLAPGLRPHYLKTLMPPYLWPSTLLVCPGSAGLQNPPPTHQCFSTWLPAEMVQKLLKTLVLAPHLQEVRFHSSRVGSGHWFYFL